MKQWTQDEAIAFECAREAITHMIAIQSTEIADEAAKAYPDAERIANLSAERSRLVRERSALHVNDVVDIARIRVEYGAVVRSWNDKPHVISS